MLQTLTSRWFDLRNRLLANPGFQRRATAFPLTRPIARRRATALFDLCAGFVYSQVLQACVQLRLFEILRDGARTTDQIAERLSLPPADTSRLLQAATALRLLQHRGPDRFGLGVLGAALVGNPAVTAMIQHHAPLYADLRDPVGLLRRQHLSTELGQLWPYAAGSNPANLPAQDVAAYTTLMAASQPLVAADVLASYRLDRHHCLMDVGGGDGTFLVQAATTAPRLDLMLFDLPAVTEHARTRFTAAGLDSRARIFGGDFRTDPLPQGADIVSLVRVVHDHDDEAAASILSASWNALPQGGTLLLAEPMAGTPAAGGMEAYFLFYLLAMGSGRPRRPDELTSMLHTAGFTRVRLMPSPQPMLVRILAAVK
ncbi:methyltransferase [Rhodopila sp.]|uniref:methyltransferase n=1 Tax=Rhodopila sp. TaxID=2480087 RepID=UPI003D105208